MAKRARMKGMDVWVVFCKRQDASEWVHFYDRHEADKYGAKMRKMGYKIKKWICRIPGTSTYPTTNYKDLEVAFIQSQYPHCVGEG